MKVDDKKLEKSDFPINKKEEKDEDKSNNILIISCIIFSIIGVYWMFLGVEEFVRPIREGNKDYNFPKLEDLNIVFIMTPIVTLLKIIIEKLAMPFSYKILLQKYKNPQDETNFILGKVYQKKLATYIYKMLFYTFMTIVGYLILSQTDFLPYELGGKGDFMKMYDAGYPYIFYYWKPDYFEIYFMLGLAFCLSDLIWLLFIYEMQSDFYLMVLHHICTISLIVFGQITNYCNLGSIVLFLHDIGDIFVYLTRLCVNTDINKKYVVVSGISLLLVFIYTRFYVFGKLILTFYFGANWEWHWVTTCMFFFASFLFIMHVNWIFLIIKKIMKVIIQNKVEDPVSIKKFETKSK